MDYIVENPIHEPASESEPARNAVLELKKFLAENNFDCVVFLGNGAVPALWGLEILVVEEGINLPQTAVLNTGKNDFREKYMHNTGEALNEDGTKTFVGESDTEENIELFCERVRNDKETLEKIKNILLKQIGEETLSGSVLIVDDMAFEGVQKLFALTVIEQLFSPAQLEYYECNMVFADKYKQGLGRNASFELAIFDEEEAKSSKRELKLMLQK